MPKKLLYCLILLICFSGYSQKVALYKQFYGSYDFTMMGNTLNKQANGDPNSCEVLTESSAPLNLSEKEADLNVKLNGIEVTSERTNYIYLDIDKKYAYFSAFADVTNIVKQFGRGEYTLSDLDLRKHIAKYCGGNYVGWSVVVVYN